MRLTYWVRFSLIIFLWLFAWWLCYWPGIINYDGSNYMNLAANGEIDSFHSHVYSLIILMFIQYTHHVTPLIFCQTLLAAIVLGRYSAAIWISCKENKKCWIFAVLLAAATIFSPLIMISAIEYIGDGGFSFAFIGLLFEIWWLIYSKNKVTIHFVLVLLFYSVIALFFRANGLILLLLIPVLTWFLVPKRVWLVINGCIYSVAIMGMIWSATSVQGIRHPLIFPVAMHSTAMIINQKGEQAISPKMRQAIELFTTTDTIKAFYSESDWIQLMLISKDPEVWIDVTSPAPALITKQFLQQELWQHFISIVQFRMRVASALARTADGYHSPMKTKEIAERSLEKHLASGQIKLSLATRFPAWLYDSMSRWLEYSYQHAPILWNGFLGLIACFFGFLQVCYKTIRFRKLPHESIFFVPLCANAVAIILLAPAMESRYWLSVTLALLPALIQSKSNG